MTAIKFVGLYWLIPLALLLTTSFFVMFALRKETSKGLLLFGKVVIVFLWLAAGIVLFTGVFTLLDDTGISYYGGCPLKKKVIDRMPMDGTCPRMSMPMPYHGSGMDNPHGGMMKYHEYDDSGNIVLEGESGANASNN